MTKGISAVKRNWRADCGRNAASLTEKSQRSRLLVISLQLIYSRRFIRYTGTRIFEFLNNSVVISD